MIYALVARGLPFKQVSSALHNRDLLYFITLYKVAYEILFIDEI